MKYLIGRVDNVPETATSDTTIYIEDGSIDNMMWDHLACSCRLDSTVYPFEFLVSRYKRGNQYQKIHAISDFLENPHNYIQLKIDQYKHGWLGESGQFIRDVCRVLDAIKP